MKLKPISDHIIIEPLKEEEKTKGGIFLPQSAEKERPEQGMVIAVGPGKTDSSGKEIPMEVKVKDKEYLIASQDDILAIIE